MSHQNRIPPRVFSADITERSRVVHGQVAGFLLGETVNILIVDDVATNRKLLRGLLEAEGYGVLEASDGMEALEVLESEQIGAVISDVLMPRMDGYRLCFHVREHERLSRLPFIIYTCTFTSESDEKLASDLNADRFIRKPASSKEIFKALADLLGGNVRPQPPKFESEFEADLLKNYSERLVAKLDEKNIALEQANTELHSTQSQLRQLLDHSSTVIYGLKVEGQNLIPYVVSENINALLGFQVDEALSSGWWAGQLHPEERDRAIASMSEILERGESRTEYRLRHRNGDYRWVEDRRHLVRDDSGHPQEIVSVWTNISDRKEAEAVFRKDSDQDDHRSKGRTLKELMVLIGISVTLFATNYFFHLNDGLLQYVWENRATAIDEFCVALIFFTLFLALFSYRKWRETKIEVLKRRAAQEALRILHTELEQKVEQRTMQLVKANEALKKEIAERKRAETSLIRLAAIVEYSHDAIIGKDLNGIITSWNKGAEHIFGYSPDEMVGSSILRLIPAERQEEEGQILRVIRDGKIIQNFETLRQTKDGRLIDVSVTTSPINDAAGSLIGVSKVARDITKRKQAEAALEKTNNQLLAVSRQAGMAEFATDVLHNVGNVLNSVTVAATCMTESLKRSKSGNLARVVDLIHQHEEDLAGFSRAIRKERRFPVTLQNWPIIWVASTKPPSKS